MTCDHCREPADELHRWDVQLCADDRRCREGWLCTKCDIALNAMTLAFFRIPRAKAKAAAYEEKQT